MWEIFSSLVFKKNFLFVFKVEVKLEKTADKLVMGLVSMGSMGLAEHINFERWVLEPINF